MRMRLLTAVKEKTRNMKEINTDRIRQRIREVCGKIAVIYPADIRKSLVQSREHETGVSRDAMDMLIENAEIAERENIPICQDTGMVIVYIRLGQEVHLTGGNLNEAVQEGVRQGYTENYLRASVVSDPLFDRKNTASNTPAVIYTEIVPGDCVEIELMAKGFGSENMSAIRMLKPAEGIEGVRAFVLETIRNAGPNACPPMIIGVGIGGTFDYCAVLAKKALMRPVSVRNDDSRYAELENDLIRSANELRIGPMGMHGMTTVLNIAVEAFPTHIAGLPCAVNICCHACRHEKVVIK